MPDSKCISPRKDFPEPSVRLSNMASLQYSVQDRSILLPWYKRRIVDPAVARFPRSLHPNTITHAGHVLNLFGLCAVVMSHPARGGLVYLVPAITLHLYNFADNADGAHARRTKQSSALGEFLDHGLDLLNVAYIATIAAFSIGASPMGTVAMVASITGAAAAVYWEQAETGVFQLGLLNQVEATFVLSFVLVCGAIFGPEAIGSLHVGGLVLREVVAGIVVVGGVVGMLHGAVRVARKRGAVLPFVTLFLFGISVCAAVATKTLSWEIGTIAAGTGYVFFGVRNLTLRMAGRKPLRETGVFVLTSVLFACALSTRLGVNAVLGARVAAMLGIAALAALSLFHAQRGIRAVQKIGR
jgi:phosphatidylglycerophosphate synthase